MSKRPFMFNVEMLADMTGGNKQYLSKKIKGMIEDPDIGLKAVLRSKKEGYQIPEEEILRCFDKITPKQVQDYKEHILNIATFPKIKKLTSKEEPTRKYLEKESEMLIQWKVRLAAAPPDKKESPEMREYLKNEIQKIKELREEKITEYIRLELLINNCDKMISEIQQKLGAWEDVNIEKNEQ